MKWLRLLKRWVVELLRPANPTFAQLTSFDGLGLPALGVDFNDSVVRDGVFVYGLAGGGEYRGIDAGDAVVGYDREVFCVGLLFRDSTGILFFKEQSFFAPIR